MGKFKCQWLWSRVESGGYLLMVMLKFRELGGKKCFKIKWQIWEGLLLLKMLHSKQFRQNYLYKGVCNANLCTAFCYVNASLIVYSTVSMVNMHHGPPFPLPN